MRSKRVSFVPLLFRYCFMIRPIFVATFILLLLTACTGYAQPAPAPDAPPASVSDETQPEVVSEDEQAAPTDSEVMYRVFAAELLGSEGNLEAAVGEYLEAALESDDPAIAMRATRVAFAAQAWQQASMAADRWALLDATSLPARESAALAMLATSDYVGAELQLQEFIALSEDKDNAWTVVSGLLARSASPEKAMKVLENLLLEAGEEGSAAGYYAQSQLAVRAADYPMAFSLAQNAVAIAPDNVDYLAWAGRLALTLGNKEGGKDFMRRAWEAEPGDHDLTLAYADLLARDGDEEAARKITREMKQTPDVMLTRILFELGAKQDEAAIKLYEEFQVADFEDVQQKSFYLAQAAEALGEMSDAIIYYGQVTDGELYPPAASRKAELLAREGNMQGAKNTLASLRLEADPIVVEQSWLTEASILQEAGDTEGALRSLDQALEQFGTSIPIRYSHALLAAQLGMVEIAEVDLRMILVEEPDHATALNALGYTLADQTDRYEEAEELIRRAYALQPDDASITDSMGWVAYRLGRLDEAEELLTRAWTLDNNPEIAAHLGEVLWQQGKQDEARVIWQQGLDVDDENLVLVETINRLAGEQ